MCAARLRADDQLRISRGEGSKAEGRRQKHEDEEEETRIKQETKELKWCLFSLGIYIFIAEEQIMERLLKK